MSTPRTDAYGLAFGDFCAAEYQAANLETAK